MADLGERNDQQYSLLFALKGELGAEKRTSARLQERVEQLVDDKSQSEGRLVILQGDIQDVEGRKK